LLRANLKSRGIEWTEVTLEPRAKLPWEPSAPLSWQLDEASRERLHSDWNYELCEESGVLSEVLKRAN
jgi:hypothetical protein